MLDNARKFLSSVLPPPVAGSAYLNIHWSAIGTEGRKFWDGRACSSVDEACKTIEWVMKQKDKDVYVCMSLQSKMEEKTSAKGHTYKKAVRLSDDAVAIKSLFIDVDVKEGAYPDTNTALMALKDFITSLGIPMPTAVVASGSGGFHVHWAMDRALTKPEWQVMANALAAATKDKGLDTDSQCTIDAARILRVPETLNLKNGEQKPVKLLSLGKEVSYDEMHTALSKYITQGPFETGAFTTSSNPIKIEANDELGANLETGKVEIRLEDVAKSCGFVARSLGTGGKDNDQPLWFLTASISSFLEDGRDALHQMSNQHATYSVKDTDELYDRASKNQKERDLGWPKCEKIAGYGCKECTTCPLLANRKSPLNFVLPVAVNQVDPTLPERFVRNGEGLIMMKIINDDGSQMTMPLCHYPIMSGWLSNNPWTFHFTTKTETGRKTTVEIPTEVMFVKEGLSKYLGAKGFFLSDKQYKIIKEFFVSWLQKLQTHKDSVISASPFGWSVVDGKVEGFTFAGRVWMKDTDRPAATPNPVLAYQYTPKGDIAVWNEAAKIVYEQKRPQLDAILAVAFAGPLVRFTGFPGLIMNAYSSESGIGKTTAMKVSQSVWGHPVLAMQGLNDTSNSVLGKMGQTRSMPVYWDEIKSEAQIKRFCSIVFELTGGREKSRMNADTTLKMSGTWQTMMVSASNDSLVDGMAREVGSTTAGLHRLFEFVVPKPNEVTHDVGVVQRLIGKLEDNYGHAGLIYSKFLGSQWKRVEQEVADMQDELYSEAKVKQEERMWVATMAVIYKGAQYANELGLTDIDLPGLRAFLFDTLSKMRLEVDASPSDLNNDMSVSSILAEFLNSTRSRNTLITNRIWVSKGKPTKGAIKILNDMTKVGEIMVHIGQEDKTIRVSSTALTRWMGERNYSRHTFIKRLEDEFGLRKVNGKLGGGTEMSCAMEHLVELDMNHPKLSTFLE